MSILQHALNQWHKTYSEVAAVKYIGGIDQAASQKTIDSKLSHTYETGSILAGEVLEILKCGYSTFVHLKTSSEKVWVLYPDEKVNIGEKVQVIVEMLMQNFTSKSLRMTFENVIIVKGAASADTPAVSTKTIHSKLNQTYKKGSILSGEVLEIIKSGSSTAVQLEAPSEKVWILYQRGDKVKVGEKFQFIVEIILQNFPFLDQNLIFENIVSIRGGDQPIVDPASKFYSSGENPYLKDYKGQCTHFVWGRAYEKLGLKLKFEGQRPYPNAKEWFYLKPIDSLNWQLVRMQCQIRLLFGVGTRSIPMVMLLMLKVLKMELFITMKRI